MSIFTHNFTKSSYLSCTYSNFDPYDDNESVMSSGTYTVSNANTPAKGSIDNAYVYIHICEKSLSR